MAKKGQKRSPAESRAIAKYYKSEKGKKRRSPTDADYRMDLKIEALTMCGPGGEMRCSWHSCQIRDPDMLSIDHTFNDGKLKRISGNALYRKIRREGNPNGRFQTLCHNHQWKKELERRREERKFQ